MAISVSRIPNEPIVIVKYLNPADPPEKQASETSRKVSEFIKDIEGIVYRINDILDYDLNFGDMTVGMAEEMKRGLPGTLSDPRIRAVTVGSTELVKLGTEAAKQMQYGGIDIKLFTSMDEALAHVRGEIANNK